MKNRFRLYRRYEGGMFYLHDSQTGKQTSLGTKDRAEAQRLFNARNESFRQPHINLQIAKAYLAGTDSGVTTRTWRHAFDAIIETKQGSTSATYAPNDSALTMELLSTQSNTNPISSTSYHPKNCGVKTMTYLHFTGEAVGIADTASMISSKLAILLDVPGIRGRQSLLTLYSSGSASKISMKVSFFRTSQNPLSSGERSRSISRLRSSDAASVRPCFGTSERAKSVNTFFRHTRMNFSIWCERV